MPTQQQQGVEPSSVHVSHLTLHHRCDGGFPYLVGKYLSDYGVVDDACFPYSRQSPCSARCKDASRRWRASNYRCAPPRAEIRSSVCPLGHVAPFSAPLLKAGLECRHNNSRGVVMSCAAGMSVDGTAAARSAR